MHRPVKKPAPPRRFACTRCKKTFVYSSHLKRHMRIHSGERPYKCDHPGCDAAFAEAGDAKKHMRTHSGERPYKCDHPGCDAAFTEAGNFKRHLRTHSGERPHKCNYPGCDAAFAQFGNLKTHMRRHNGERPYKCDHPGCDVAFTTAGNLKTHMRTHSGERSYKCNYPGCGAAFTGSGNVKKHMRTHSGERPYKCDHPGCDAAFTVSCNLKTHNRVHTGERPYMCHYPDCGRRFAQSGQRDLHEKNFHDKRRCEQYVKKKEEWTRALFTANSIVYDREVHITYQGCGENDTWARLDFVIYKEDHIVIVSIDEFQHRDYEVECDVARMSKVVVSIRAAGDMRRILWLRFNPDTFEVHGVRTRVPPTVRGRVLVDSIRRSAELLGGRDLAVVYMYYDCTLTQQGDSVAEITHHPSYSPLWKQVVVPRNFL